MEEAFRLFKSTREYFTPVLTETAFYDRGLLTPEEFVRAGDQLIRNCPSWQWESGEASKIRPYLPPDKQFLSTRGVPSYSRASVLQASKVSEDMVRGGLGDAEGDWCAPALLNPDHDPDEVLVEAEDAMDVASDAAVQKAPAVTSPTKDEEYLDMEDESLALDDAATTGTSNTSNAKTSSAQGGNGAGSAAANNLVRTRRYDVSITYDNYYRTPRIWLFGFDENGSALSTTDIYQVRNFILCRFSCRYVPLMYALLSLCLCLGCVSQDVMQDYAKKTVTIDPHPHLSRPHGI
jgi:ubiquitin-like-conjugating enzyme ATG3